MAAALISDQEFDQLQNQIIELRTQNYELGSKLQKIENEKSQIQEKCNGQEKELQKVGKLMKFPGFQAMRNSKSKKDIAELIEENERLTLQMQRHEDDFKLQNQTFLEEISRLTAENETLQNEQPTSTLSSSSDKEYLQLQDRNSILQKTIDELNINLNDHTYATTNNSSVNNDDILAQLNRIEENINEKLKSLTSSQNNSEKENIENNVEDLDTTDSVHTNKPLDFREYFDGQFNTLKSTIQQHSIQVNTQDANLMLQTTQKELQLLKTNFHSYKEASKVEKLQLREEVGKWEVKTKKKQESFIKLQEEKEKSYKDNRLAQEKLQKERNLLEEELNKKIEILENQVKQYQESNQSDQMQAMLDIVRSENQAMQEELIGLKEKCRDDQIEQLKDLKMNLEQTINEKEQVQSKLKECEVCSELLQADVEQLKKEVVELTDKNIQAEELAQKRKAILDETSLQRHGEIEAHQAKLDELKQSYENETQHLVTKHKGELEDLKTQIVGNKKLKKELEDSKQQVLKFEEDITSLEKKSGWLERTLKETEENLEKANQEHEESIIKIEEQHHLDIVELKNQHAVVIKEMESKIQTLTHENEGHLKMIEKLKQATVDKEVEFRITAKKSEHLLKDLRRQCKSESKRADQLQLKLQDFIQDIKVKHTYDEIFNPESLQLKVAAAGHRRNDSGSHLSLVSSLSGADEDFARSAKTSSPVESAGSVVGGSYVGGLSEETMDLVSRIADLQQEKWQLEERVRHLEENGGVMADDLMQKSLIIQTYVMENKPDLTPQKQRSLTLKEKMMDRLRLGNSDELNKEMTSKMQRMLEETLARNAQLQKDVDTLSNELHKQSKPST